jgi:transposase InsO family protein
MGIKRVMSLLTPTYFWSNMTTDVKEVIQQCDACARKGGLQKLKEDPELKPIPPGNIFERVCVDLMGPMPKTPRKSKYIAVAVCHFSKYVCARAIPDKKSETVARFFLEEVIAAHGVPKIVQTDKGTEFLDHFEELMKQCGIKHITSSAYRPEGNGMVERMVQNILHSLQRAAMERPDSWDLELPWVLLGSRAAKAASTLQSPFFLVYARNPCLPVDRKLMCDPEIDREGAVPESSPGDDPANLPHNVDLNLQARSEAVNTAAEEALQNIRKAQEQQKKAYRKRRGLLPDPRKTMPPGSMVLMKAPASNKLAAGCEGPYRVVDYHLIDTSKGSESTPSRVTLEDASGKVWGVHVSRIFPYTPRNEAQATRRL